MKRIIVLVLLVLSIIPIFASKLVKVDFVDDFGDPTGKYYLCFDSDLSGTYKTSSVSNGKLKWNVIIEPTEGAMAFIIKEDGKSKDITTGGYSGCYNSHKVSFKNEKGEVYTQYCGVDRSFDYVSNLLGVYDGSGAFYEIWDCRTYLISNKKVKISIKSKYGTYSLGAVDFSDLEELCYDKSDYQEAVSLFEAGKYYQAWKEFEEYRLNNPKGFEYFKAYEPFYKCCEKIGKYAIGMTGPAGGYIFYDCDADNDSGNADGLISSECGWRYLEAAPEDLSTTYPFGYYRPDGKTNTRVGTVERIGRGKSNTEALVSSMGDEAYISASYDTTGSYAALECYNYSIESEGKIYDDWFLPSKEELNLMYMNLCKKGLENFQSSLYWSSSEYSSGSAWRQSFNNGGQSNNNRDYDDYVRPIRAFL